MTTSSTPVGCLERAIAHQDTAILLHERDNEWFAVAYFYAAYQLVRSALLADPVFADVKRLQSLGLIPDDKTVERHQGRVSGGSRTVGVNDLVRKLYPSIAPKYLQLHEASIQVRYGDGLRPVLAAVVKDYYRDIATLAKTGSLQA